MTGRPEGRSTCINAIYDTARRQPGQLAVDGADGTGLTYGRLWQRSGWLAAALAADGIGRGDRVALAMDRSPEFVVAVLGAARAGAAYVPLDPLAPPARHALILRDADVRAVISDRGREGAIPVPDADAGLPVPDVDLAGDDPLYVGFTSGSTGLPKGVVVPHQAVASFTHQPLYCPVTRTDRVANIANPAFDATTFEIWNTLVAGATVVILPSLADTPVQEWRDLLREYAVTKMFLTTALFHAVAREDPAAWNSLDTLLVGGELADVDAVAAVLAAEPPRRLLHVYGPTETTTFATYFECTGTDLPRLPIGGPVQACTLYVLGDERWPVPDGERGELYIGGPQVATGYLGRPDLTAERFVILPNGERVYRTGDLVRRLPGGELDFLGRADRQVKLRGFRIEPEEIEYALAATGLVTDAHVAKVGEQSTAHLVGFVRPSGDGDPSADLTAALRERMPPYMVPTRWVVVPAMPINGVGKVDRDALLTMLDVPDAAPSAPSAPSAPVGTASAICAVLADLLGVERVRPEDNFLDIGGTSIVALQATARLRSRLGAVISPADMLFTDTIADLAAQVDEQPTVTQ
jgi:amino acid adenylation domain-containing protein